jgi:hypothetical protein
MDAGVNIRDGEIVIYDGRDGVQFERIMAKAKPTFLHSLMQLFGTSKFFE